MRSAVHVVFKSAGARGLSTAARCLLLYLWRSTVSSLLPKQGPSVARIRCAHRRSNSLQSRQSQPRSSLPAAQHQLAARCCLPPTSFHPHRQKTMPNLDTHSTRYIVLGVCAMRVCEALSSVATHDMPNACGTSAWQSAFRPPFRQKYTRSQSQGHGGWTRWACM